MSRTLRKLTQALKGHDGSGLTEVERTQSVIMDVLYECQLCEQMELCIRMAAQNNLACQYNGCSGKVSVARRGIEVIFSITRSSTLAVSS